ncbi:UAA transporter like protein [Aduncisulcus paluster]|uniref:UAA transporter like protein n=1 Tax=Aduncisulcus paluster TaxID=2918883 RepID=A0ABQ5KIJ0_9EUKA|nr:UAA transporter like protein [Aduncisulcus paluster]
MMNREISNHFFCKVLFTSLRQNMSPNRLIICSAGLLIFGAANTIITQWEYSLSAIGRDGHTVKYMSSKPFTYWNLAMFVGMSLSMFMFIYERVQIKKLRQEKVKREEIVDSSQHLGDDKPVPASKKEKEQNLDDPAPWWVFVPSSVFDLLGTGLGNVGFAMGVSPSIFQLLSGSIIIFTALLSIIFLKKRLKGYEWYAIGIATLGLICVAMTGAFTADDDEQTTGSVGQQILGMVLIVLGQVVYAGQFCVEEHVMANMNASPNQTVGFEGVYGMILTLLIVVPLLWLIPGNDNGHEEDFFESFIMIGNNPFILVPTFAFIVSIVIYNVAGQNVTAITTCVHRTLLEALRSVLVWIISVIMGYTLHNSALGEKLTWWSFLEAAGFILITYGTLVYNQIVKHEGLFNYLVEKEPEDKKSLIESYQEDLH